MRAGNIEPNCDFQIVSSTFGCTGKVTPKRSWRLVNSTYSWADAAPAMARIRAADTTLTRMMSLYEFPTLWPPDSRLQSPCSQPLPCHIGVEELWVRAEA